MPNRWLHGVALADTNASHVLTILVGSNLSADRTFTLTTGDASRTLTLTADSSIGGTAYVSGGTDVALADGGTGASLADPNADRFLFWDDSAGAVAFLAPNYGVSIDTTNLNVSLSSGEAVITSSHSITSSSGTYEDVTGLSLSLPAAGTYLVLMTLRGNLQISAGTVPFIVARLDLNGSTVSNSESLVVLNGASTTGVAFQNTISAARIVVAAGAHTLKVQAKRDGTTVTYTTSTIAADANGKSALAYVRIA